MTKWPWESVVRNSTHTGPQNSVEKTGDKSKIAHPPPLKIFKKANMK